MAAYFLDTSALFKRYIPEEGSPVLDQIFQSGGTRLISNLTITEMVSNLQHLVKVSRRLDEKDFQIVKTELWADIADGTLEVYEVTRSDILFSVELITKSYLSPIDSIHLAIALRLARQNEVLVFVCTDAKLCQLATAEGLSVLNPLEPSNPVPGRRVPRGARGPQEAKF